MDKNEIIFLTAMVVIYIVFILISPATNAYMLLALLAIAVLLMLMFRFKERFENQRISNALKILSILSIALYLITSTYESFAKNTLMIDSGIFIFLFAVFMVSFMFFKKEE